MVKQKFLLPEIGDNKKSVIGWIAEEDGLWDCGDCDDCSAYGTDRCLKSPSTCIKCGGETFIGEYCTLCAINDEGDLSTEGLVEDAHDNRWMVVVRTDRPFNGLYETSHCPECHGNSRLLFREFATNNYAYICTCGHRQRV